MLLYQRARDLPSRLSGVSVFAGVMRITEGASKRQTPQLSGKAIDNRVDVSFAESSVELLYQIDILLLLHGGWPFRC